MRNRIEVSVRGLVEYVYRSGSIDLRFRSSQSLTNGTKVHQKLQSQYGEDDQKEVPLHIEILHNEFVYEISGRCDGILQRNEEFLIDEIKSTSLALTALSMTSHPDYWAQAKVYAYIFAKQSGIGRISVQLTYVSVQTEEVKRFVQSYTVEELEKFIVELVTLFAPFAELRANHILQRNQGIKAMSFPFQYFRKGQRKLAGGVYKSIVDGRNLFAMAPTGIGKTISTTFPAVKAIGEGHIEKLYYLTAKTITRQAAEEAFQMMTDHELNFTFVTITAKEKACLKEKVICQKDYCEFANGYYDRLNMAIIDVFKNERSINRSVLEQYARKHMLCPFEFSLDVSYLADAVICDYNYIFDPRVSLKRLFDEQKSQTVLLVDEAHNLVDRAREMFSAPLLKSNYLTLKNEYKGKNREISQAAKVVNDWFIRFRKNSFEQDNPLISSLPEKFIEDLEQFRVVGEMELLAETSGEADTHLLECYFLTQNFLRIHRLFDERYVTYLEIVRNEVVLKLFCLDPSHLLKQMTKGFSSTVYFSATLTPIDYYQSLLGADEEDYYLRIPSPFQPEQIQFSIHSFSTRFKDRERTKKSILEIIKRTIVVGLGNYLVFFPSYQYMIALYEEFMGLNLEATVILQAQGMTEEEKEDFLAAFVTNPSKTLVGFAVLGGVFSEGVDLKGDRLSGVIVVGVGLPQICLERDLIKNYFQSTGKNGYDYAYLFPGMNKVLQAGGRLIRTEDDYGSITLIDDRFHQPKYQSLLPEEWK